MKLKRISHRLYLHKDLRIERKVDRVDRHKKKKVYYEKVKYWIVYREDKSRPLFRGLTLNQCRSIIQRL